MMSRSVPRTVFVVLAVCVGVVGACGVLAAAQSMLLLSILMNGSRPFECPQLIVWLISLLTLPATCLYSLNMAVDRFRHSTITNAYLWFLLPIMNLMVLGAIFLLPPCVGSPR